MAYQPTQEDKSTGLIIHLLVLLTWWIGPLVMYFMKKEDPSPFVRLHAKQGLVFSLAITVVHLISIPLMCIGVGFFTFSAASIVCVIYAILAMIKTNQGEKFLYPFVANKFCQAEVAAVYGDAAPAPVAGTPPVPPAQPQQPPAQQPPSEGGDQPPSPSA